MEVMVPEMTPLQNHREPLTQLQLQVDLQERREVLLGLIITHGETRGCQRRRTTIWI